MAGSDKACFFQFVGDSDKKEVKYPWCDAGLCSCSDRLTVRHKLGVRRSVWGKGADMGDLLHGAPLATSPCLEWLDSRFHIRAQVTLLARD